MFNNLRLNPSDIFNNDFQRQKLRHTVVRGGMALLLSQGISIGLSMINTLVLARLLAPSDFGIIGMVTVFINFLILFKDAGLSTATIQKDKINNKQISTLFWINLIISLILSLVMLISSPLVASFYRRPELASVTAVLSISFIIQGFSIQHNALLQRHLKFKTTAINEIIAQLSSITVAITMASLGFRYWALIGGTLARSLMLLILTFYFCPWIPNKMQKGTGVRNMLKFGGHLTGSYFIGFLSRNLDSLLIGKLIGAGPLGLYNRAFSLLMQPLNQISGPLSSLSLPVLSSLKKDPPRYQSYYLQLLDVLISLALPISVYCFLEGEFLIRILLGQKWMAAVPVFKILSVGGMFVAISSAPGLVMLSHGFSKRYFHLNILTSSITSVALIVGVFFGIKGVAIAYTIASFLKMFPLIGYSFRDTPIKLRMIIEAISGPVFAAAIAGISAYMFIILYSTDDIVKHILTGLIFFIIYVALTSLRSATRDTLKSIIESVV
jgi:O-antigen/teichoic acid export membrane protein